MSEPTIFAEAVKETTFLEFDFVKQVLSHHWAEVLKVDKWSDIYVDPDNKLKIRGICRWILGDGINGKYDPTKGFYIFGPNNNGKTEFAKALSRTLVDLKVSYNHTDLRYKWLVYSEMKSYMESKGSMRLLDAYRQQSVYIDDLGYDEDDQLKYSFINGKKGHRQ